MRKRYFIIQLEYDADLMHGTDPEDIKWFEELVLREERLHLFSSYIGDDIGEVKIIEEINAKGNTTIQINSS